MHYSVTPFLLPIALVGGVEGVLLLAIWWAGRKWR